MFTEEYYWLPAGVTWTKLEDYAKSASANVIPHRVRGLFTQLTLTGHFCQFVQLTTLRS